MTDSILKGFEVVPGELFGNKPKATLIIREGKILLNPVSVAILNPSQYGEFYFNPKERKIVVKTCDENSKNAIRFTTLSGRPKEFYHITLYDKVMETMKWDPNYKYRLVGKEVDVEGSTGILYYLDYAEKLPLKQVRNYKK